MKICGDCKVEKSLTEFYNVKSRDDGKHLYCKDCCKLKRAVECVKKRDKRVKISIRQAYRCRELNVAEIDPNVKLHIIFKNSRGICGICDKWVKPNDASPDHIKPVSKGGSHTYDNMQLTHLTCNLRKGNRE